MTAKSRVAVVSHEVNERRKLATYLISVGFEVDECSNLVLPTTHTAVVIVAKDDAAPDALQAQVRAWIELGNLRRVVVVTSKPAALRPLLFAHSARLFVLAAPAFGWHVVDALRAPSSGSLPQGA